MASQSTESTKGLRALASGPFIRQYSYFLSGYISPHQKNDCEGVEQLKQGASQNGKFPQGTVKILMTLQALLPPLIPSSSIFWCWVEPRDSHMIDKCSPLLSCMPQVSCLLLGILPPASA